MPVLAECVQYALPEWITQATYCPVMPAALCSVNSGLWVLP